LKKENTISFILTGSNHILIECKVNYISGIFIVDTGASNSCVNYLSASKFNIEFEASNEKASSATDEINEIFNSKKNILKIGDFQKNDFDLVLFDMTFINNSLKEKGVSDVDGIIGGDILNELNACLNYKKKEISLEF
jgi:predicted aspartyl protease